MNREQVPGIVIGKLMNIGGMLQRHGDRLLQPYNLNYQQFFIFFEIAKVGTVKQKDMVNRLQLEKSHVSKVVKKLHRMGLITVSETEEDKRASWLAVTPKGEETLALCRKMFGEWHKEWTSSISEDEFSSILDNLTRLQALFRDATR